MILRLGLLFERLRASYWFVPAFLGLLAIALSFAMVGLDHATSESLAQRVSFIYSGGPDGARGVLSTIAGSVIGVAGTTFSITIAVLSLASGQYGPRLLRGFMRDLGNQIVLGTFTATYIYCLMTLRTIRGTEATKFVPYLSVTAGIGLAVLSVAVLIYFVHHVAESIQVSHIIEEVGREADAAIERLFPKEVGKRDGDPELPTGEGAVVRSKGIGYVASVDGEALLRIARDRSLVVRMEARPGDYVLPHAPLFTVWPATNDHDEALRKAVAMGRQRTTYQDAEYALLQLTEMAVRALSSGVNDPFTAIQCLDRTTASMCLLVERPWPTPYRSDDADALRVIARPFTPGDLVRAAYGHIIDSVEGSPAVVQRLRECLDLLIDRANGALREALAESRASLPER